MTLHPVTHVPYLLLSVESRACLRVEYSVKQHEPYSTQFGPQSQKPQHVVGRSEEGRDASVPHVVLLLGHIVLAVFWRSGNLSASVLNIYLLSKLYWSK